MTDDPVSAELLEAQQTATRIECPTCRGRGTVAAGQRPGEFVVRVAHFRTCPRRAAGSCPSRTFAAVVDRGTGHR